MSLQRKFAALLAMVVVAVGVIAGTSLWSVLVLQREVAYPLASIQSVLSGLHEVRHASTRIGDLMASGTPGGAEMEAQADVIERQLARLGSDETYLVRSGVSTTRALRDAAARLEAARVAWVGTGDPAARTRASEAIATITGLIERVETRVIDDMALATLHAREVRRLVMLSLVVAVVSVLLAGALGAVLVRRWIVRPVRRLREAAARFEAGDLDYRLPVEGADELSMLSGEVNSMAARISAMQEERIERERLAAVGEMVRRIAHNIRNPLAGIRSLAELTRGDLADHPELAENQDRIVRTIDRFETWVEQLLTATKPLSLSPARTEVRPWLRAMVELRRATAERMDVRLTLHDASAPEAAPFDARHLEQAVGAIIDNALGVTPGGGEVRVEVSRDEDAWVIEVLDAGPGVPAELREKVFASYFTTRRDGTGLGLAMARHVVEQHAGAVRVVPSDEGARFRIELPMGEATDRDGAG